MPNPTDATRIPRRSSPESCLDVRSETGNPIDPGLRGFMAQQKRARQGHASAAAKGAQDWPVKR